MNRVLVTGGAGFIGRWLVKRLLEDETEVWVLDNLDNGREENLEEFRGHPLLREVVIDDIRHASAVQSLFRQRFDQVYHLAAQINVQESIENPQKAYDVNVGGTFQILEACRAATTPLLLMGTCMVYDVAGEQGAIGEDHALKPVSPYAGSKLAAEFLAESYYRAYGLPLVICRPFNTYGPFQKHNLEGGVVSIFVRQELKGEPLKVFGDGTQTRDFLYVEDCVDFLVRAAHCDRARGRVLNAGSGKDIAIADLARMICRNESRIQFVPHHHPQAEIKKLLCDSTRARDLLGWTPATDLATGIDRLRQWQRTLCVSA